MARLLLLVRVHALAGALAGTSLAAGCKHAARANSGESPVAIAIIGVPAELAEGASTELHAEVQDRTGSILDSVSVSWTSDASIVARVEGGRLVAAHEGDARITARSGLANVQQPIRVESPLLGEWERATPPLQGMRVRIERAADHLVGTVILAPTLAPQVYWEQAAQKAWPKKRALQAAQCAVKAWAPGVREFRSITRASDSRWSVEVAKKTYFEIGLFEDGCGSDAPEFETMDGTLTDADAFRVQTSDVASEPRVWKRVK